jgi:hypothetical protein
LIWGFLACTTPEPPPIPAQPKVVPATEPVPELLEKPPSSGIVCTSSADCPPGREGRAAYCFCSEPIPEGMADASGFCWNGRVKAGPDWWCTVEGGKAIRLGVVFMP